MQNFNNSFNFKNFFKITPMSVKLNKQNYNNSIQTSNPYTYQSYLNHSNQSLQPNFQINNQYNNQNQINNQNQQQFSDFSNNYNIRFDDSKNCFIIEKNNNFEYLNMNTLIKCFYDINQIQNINPLNFSNNETTMTLNLIFVGSKINTESLLFSNNYIYDFIKLFKVIDNDFMQTIYKSQNKEAIKIFNFIKYLMTIIIDKLKNYEKSLNDMMFMILKYIEINNFITETLINENNKIYNNLSKNDLESSTTRIKNIVETDDDD